MSLIVQVLWLAAPAIVAGVLHMVVVKRNWLAPLAIPLDGGRNVFGHRLFGDNKTWRGVVAMVGLGALVGAVQGGFSGDVAADHGWSVLGDVGLRVFGVDSFAAQYAAAHAVFGLGYALGELPNSFLKRRLHIGPGQKGRGVVGAVFFVVDQADSVVAAFALGALFFPFGVRFVVVGSVLLSGVHLAVNAALAAARIKRDL